MTEALVRYRLDGRIATLTLDSPRNHNALSTALVSQLRRGFDDAAAAGARAVVLGHTGRTFCAGADLTESSGDGRSAAPRDVAMDRAREMTQLLRAILELPVPVIAVVNGHVRAGGMGLIGAADIAVAGPDSTFALTEARIGVAPSIISLTLLPKMTARAAGRYFLTGEKFGPTSAAEIGLISIAAVDTAAMEATVTALTEDIAKASPQGLAAAKALTTAPILAGFDARAEKLAAQSAALFASTEAHEGMLAFLQKRPPSWV